MRLMEVRRLGAEDVLQYGTGAETDDREANEGSTIAALYLPRDQAAAAECALQPSS
jgi:hypothetical protein